MLVFRLLLETRSPRIAFTTTPTLWWQIFQPIDRYVAPKKKTKEEACSYFGLVNEKQLAGMTQNPIIFICHSLGGIVVKRVSLDNMSLPRLSLPIFLAMVDSLIATGIGLCTNQDWKQSIT